MREQWLRATDGDGAAGPVTATRPVRDVDPLGSAMRAAERQRRLRLGDGRTSLDCLAGSGDPRQPTIAYNEQGNLCRPTAATAVATRCRRGAPAASPR